MFASSLLFEDFGVFSPRLLLAPVVAGAPEPLLSRHSVHPQRPSLACVASLPEVLVSCGPCRTDGILCLLPVLCWAGFPRLLASCQPSRDLLPEV